MPLAFARFSSFSLDPVIWHKPLQIAPSYDALFETVYRLGRSAEPYLPPYLGPI